MRRLTPLARSIAERGTVSYIYIGDVSGDGW